MTNQDIAMTIRSMINSSSSMMLDARFQNKESAQQLLNYMLILISQKTNVTVENMLEPYLLKYNEIKREKEKTLYSRYGTAFSDEVYAEMDRLIREGYNNKVIADRLGIHRNTVSSRRKKLMGY